MTDVTKEDIAKMVALNGMGYDYGEVAAKTGYSESTVGKYIRQVKAEADAGNWEEVYWQYTLEMVYNEDMVAGLAGMISP